MQPGTPALPDELVYPSLGPLACVIGIALAALIIFVLPERGELDHVLVSTDASPGMRRFGQELPVLVLLAGIAAIICLPLSASLSGRRPALVDAASTTAGSFLLALLGLATGRLIFLLAEFVLLRARMHSIVARGAGALGVLAASGLALRLGRPGGTGSSAVDDVLERTLLPVLLARSATPVAWLLLSSAVVALVALGTRVPSPHSVTATMTALSLPGWRWGRSRSFCIFSATLTSGFREPVVFLWCVVSVVAPGGLALVDRLTGSPFLLFAPYLVILPGLAAGYIYGTTSGVRALLGATGLRARHWFGPQALAALATASIALLLQSTVAVVVANGTLGHVAMTIPLAMIAASMGLLVGHLAPVRTTDHTSSVTYDFTAVMLTIATLAVVLHVEALQTTLGLIATACTALGAALSIGFAVDRRRPAIAVLE